MAYETKNNTGSLFPNKNKKEDKHPDYTGKMKVNGQLMDMAGWINDYKDGKYLNLKISEYKPQTNETREYTTRASDDATIPF